MRATRRARRAAQQLFRLCLVDGKLDEERVRQVVRRIVESRRRDGLGVLSHVQRLVRLDRARHTAIVESATPLPHDLREEVRASLARTYRTELETSFEHHPELIAGVRIKVGSDVYDGSVRARLAALAARM